MAGLGRWRAVVAIVLVVAAGLTGWSSTGFDRTPPPAPSRVRPRGPAGQPATRPGARASRPSHLIVVVEENHSLEQIIGSPAAPFLNHLAAHGTLLTDYHAITHPSLPNYVALLGGRTGRIQSDCVHCTISGPTLIDQLQARHISWAAYLQGLPRPCSAVASSGAYTEAVDPFIHAVRVRDDPARCDRVLPFRFLHADLAAGRLPTVFFVVPDLYHDMHSRPVLVADRWLRRLVAELEVSPVWRQDTRLVVTFDESTRHDVRSCCGGLGRGGRAAIPLPTLTTRCFTPWRPPSGCRSWGTPATRPPPPSRPWPTRPLTANVDPQHWHPPFPGGGCRTGTRPPRSAARPCRPDPLRSQVPRMAAASPCAADVWSPGGPWPGS